MAELFAGSGLEAALLLGGLALTGLVAAGGALWVLVLVAPESRRDRRAMITGADADVAFLFDGEALVDASAQARQFLEAAPRGGSDWSRLMMLLLPRFPEVEARIGSLIDEGAQDYVATDGASRLVAEWRGGLVRLMIVDAEASGGTVLDRHGVEAMERELGTLREVVEHTPALIWRQGSRGRITWANRAYLEMVTRAKGQEDAGMWPPPTLFEPADLMRRVESDGVSRLALALGLGRRLWFDCQSHRMADDVLFIATDVNAAVHAEGQLREFMQTLTKTFAHLTIGLAIFDRSRHLALFNPALTDLTELPVDFLAARPTLFGFLDRLREKKMIPEPKDYKGWRKKLLELEAAAETGTYAETWTLPSGRTYRVTGRPHPEGAVAFLFENISAEVSLTRQFRAELEMGQAVIDNLDEAIAVFSRDGVLTMTNKAYAALWGDDPSTSLRDIGVADATRTWRERCVPSPIWGDIREFAGRLKERTEWCAEVRMADGRGLACRIAPLAGGATLVGFRAVPGESEIGRSAPAPALPKAAGGSA